jgi:ATP synthase protein I
MSGMRGAPDPAPKDKPFEDRLTAARFRQGLDAAPAGTPASDASALGLGMRVGVELFSALAVAVAIGWGLDHWLHTMPLFLILFVLLGGAAGSANLWRMVAPPGRPPSGRDG